MIALLGFIIVILVALMLYQSFTINKTKNNQIFNYVAEKLVQIQSNETNERLLYVTENHHAQKMLTELNRLLDEKQIYRVNRVKTEESMRKMLSNISHDLKTPLTAIFGYLELLKLDKDMSNEQNSKVENIHQKASEVMELINKFFDLAKLEAGDVMFERTKLQLNEVCRKNILSYYDYLSAREALVELNIPESPYYILGDEDTMDRILQNLLSNAIKYGLGGKVIGMTLRCENENVCIDVWDRGKGIQEIYYDKVFERMFTLEDSRNHSYKGSGIGLTITKRLVEAMDGEVKLVSIPYEKTMFTVSFKRLSTE